MSKKPNISIVPTDPAHAQRDLFNADGLINAITGMGLAADKHSYSRFVPSAGMIKTELEAMYRQDWITGKAIDEPANDMVREWRDFETEDEEVKKQILKEERRLQYKKKVHDALKWSRLYGGSVLLINVDDGQLPSAPLNINTIKEGGLRWLSVLDRWQLSSTNRVITDPMNPQFGLPEYYIISGTVIHHSRVIRFEGVDLPRDVKATIDYWGDPVIYRIRDAIIDASTVNRSIATMFHEATLDVMKIPGLMHMVGDCEGEKTMLLRMKAVQLSKSIHNMLLLDGDETYEKKQLNLTGAKDLITEYLHIVSGATGIPVAKLLGMAPAGLSTDGDSQFRNYYDRISNLQETDLRNKLDYIDEIMFRSLGMKEALPYEFNPLWQLTEKEQAEVDKLRAERDTAYSALVPGSSILRKIQQEGTYKISDELIEEMEELESQEAPEPKEEDGDDELPGSTTETPPTTTPQPGSEQETD